MADFLHTSAAAGGGLTFVAEAMMSAVARANATECDGYEPVLDGQDLNKGPDGGDSAAVFGEPEPPHMVIDEGIEIGWQDASGEEFAQEPVDDGLEAGGGADLAAWGNEWSSGGRAAKWLIGRPETRPPGPNRRPPGMDRLSAVSARPPWRNTWICLGFASGSMVHTSEMIR